MPKINGNEIKPGNVLDHDGGLWATVKVDHVKPGKGWSFCPGGTKKSSHWHKTQRAF